MNNSNDVERFVSITDIVAGLGQLLNGTVCLRRWGREARGAPGAALPESAEKALPLKALKATPSPPLVPLQASGGVQQNRSRLAAGQQGVLQQRPPGRACAPQHPCVLL